MKTPIAAALLALAAPLALAQATPVGLWKTIDDDGKTAKSLVRISEQGGTLVGSIDKVLADNGKKLKKFGKIVAEFIEEEGVDEAMQEFINPLADLGDKVTKLTTELGMKAFSNPDEVGGAAVDYLRVCGHLVFAYFFARSAKIALAKKDSGDPFYTAKLHTARFYFAKLLPETASLIRTCRAGLAPLMEMEEALF